MLKVTNSVVNVAMPKAKQAATQVANKSTKVMQGARELMKPLQGGVSSVGKEANYLRYLDLMA